MRQRYTKADTARLQSYIADLKAQIAALTGVNDGTIRRRGLVVDL
jgi:hypothetical protein